MRSLRWLGLIGFTLFVVAAFTPLANLLNVRMAGVADVGPSDAIDMPRSRALMERAGFVVRPAPTAAGGPSNPEARLGLVRDIAIELTAWAYYRLRGIL